ncbi:hypothetical protein SAMN05421841_2484 [Chryseobacterium wanjuense]|uniref:Uncharacterized protein n=1 Tax=Chryseobacterium wanjuense TaxID=356305 RepID=A0A1I0RCL5_9FLAO|nr:hypothetical protein [Chryseobacterium wanjuense]SEW38587.1 hypothetical protein SAMN05421841_2484 [Chryseobacterium wanjuense]
MDIDGFRAELETRLLIEKEYIIQELSSVKDYQERLELLGKFNQKYRELIKRLAHENGIDLNASYQTKDPSNSENLSYEQIILGKTMGVYDKLVEELYEEITRVN